MPPQTSLPFLDDDQQSLDELFLRSRLYETSAGYLEVLQFVTKLRRYKPYNGFLLKMQNPNVTFVASPSYWWSEFHRTVNAGARPMVILIPFGPVDFVWPRIWMCTSPITSRPAGHCLQ